MCFNFIHIQFVLCIQLTGREVDWVQCDGGCNEWFHMECVGLNKNQVTADDEFVCKKCKKVTTSTSKSSSPITIGGNTRKSTNKLDTNKTNSSTSTVCKKRTTRSEEDLPDDSKNIEKDIKVIKNILNTMKSNSNNSSTVASPNVSSQNSTAKNAQQSNQASTPVSSSTVVPAKKKKQTQKPSSSQKNDSKLLE